MSPAHMQQAQQAAAQVAARLGQPGGNYHHNSTIPNPDAVQKAKELISKMIPQTNNMGGGGGGGPGGPGGPPRPGMGSNAYEEIMIPGSKVGLIIGKGGETIKQLQERTGAKMVVVQDGPGQEMEKPLRISGDPQKVEHAKQLVFELIQDKGDQQQGNNRGGSGGGGGGYNNRQQDRGDHGSHGGGGGGGYGGGGQHGGDSMEIFVPKLAVGVVIGKGGDMIKKIQAETGCRLQFLQTKNDGPGDRRCLIQGSKQQVDDGKRMIEDLIESVMRRNSGNNHQSEWNGGSGGSSNSGGYQQHQQSQSSMQGGVQVQQEQYQFVVPASKCGIIIGRSGDTIKQINSQSGAHCEMDRKVSANQTVEKTFTVKGEQHQVDEAKRLIQDKINMDIQLVHMGSQTVTQPSNGGGYGGGGGGQGSQNPYAAGQSWGGYGAGSNQGWDQGGQPGQMGAQPGAMPGGQGQPDYSQQWIEYYRSMGMTREAEAIEAQVKAKQSTGGQVSGKFRSHHRPSEVEHRHSLFDRSCSSGGQWRGSRSARCSKCFHTRLQCRVGQLLPFIGKD